MPTKKRAPARPAAAPGAAPKVSRTPAATAVAAAPPAARAAGRDAAVARAAGSRMRSSGPEESVARILDATMDAIANQGLRQLSMSEVCRVASVARGTLYRYFPTREDLMEGISQRVRQRFEDDLLAHVAAGSSDVMVYLDSMADFLADYAVRSRTAAMLKVEPGYVLGFLAGQMDHYGKVLAQALAPVFDEAEQRSGRKIDRLAWAQLLMRLNVSLFLLPPAAGTAKQALRRYFKAAVPALFGAQVEA